MLSAFKGDERSSDWGGAEAEGVAAGCGATETCVVAGFATASA